MTAQSLRRTIRFAGSWSAPAKFITRFVMRERARRKNARTSPSCASSSFIRSRRKSWRRCWAIWPQAGSRLGSGRAEESRGLDIHAAAATGDAAGHDRHIHRSRRSRQPGDGIDERSCQGRAGDRCACPELNPQHRSANGHRARDGSNRNECDAGFGVSVSLCSLGRLNFLSVSRIRSFDIPNDPIRKAVAARHGLAGTEHPRGRCIDIGALRVDLVLHTLA